MRVQDLETPAVVIEKDIVDNNLKRAQDYANAHNLKLRPHIKTHKLPHIAHQQLELGAIGITCQKLGEAEIMTEAGISDIFIPYNILGPAKLDRLHMLHEKITLCVAADSAATIAGYACRFTEKAHKLPVLVECDTGAGRCGVQTPQAALELAKLIAAAPGLSFEGLMTYPPRQDAERVDTFFKTAKDLIEAEGIPVNTISNGGSPDFYEAEKVTSATEHRPGTYVYNDRMQVEFGQGTLEDCALTVLATVVSRPTPDRAILDSGSKALAMDPSPAAGHGHIREFPGAVITSLSEEHAIVDVSACAEKPGIGQRVNVIPNHVCVVTNLFDQVHFIRNNEVIAAYPIEARGKLT